MNLDTNLKNNDNNISIENILENKKLEINNEHMNSIIEYEDNEDNEENEGEDQNEELSEEFTEIGNDNNSSSKERTNAKKKNTNVIKKF